MKRARAHALALACLSIAAAIVGCGAHEIAIEIDFTPDSLADDASAIELHVVDRCADVIRGQVPGSSLASVAFRRDEPPRGVPGALPERFGVAVIARDDRCGIVGFGCLDASRGVSSLRIEVTSVSGSTCEASARCDDGLCVAGDVPDASIDASTIDARVTPDTSEPDADPDAWVPEMDCDCRDDDVDGRVDEGCASEVLWQTPVDAPGRQGFRGAMLGGDLHVYLNGWMDTLGSAVMLCGAGPFTGTGTGGNSYTVALDAITGACTTVLERTAMGPFPGSAFASPQRGHHGVWIFGGEQVFEISGTTGIDSMPLATSAAFGIGEVLPRPRSSTELLLHWAHGSPVVPTLEGTVVGVGGSDPIVLASGSPASVVRSTNVLQYRQFTLDYANVGWIDSDLFFVVAPSSGGPGFPCENTSEHPSSGDLRIEIRDVDAMSLCVDAFGLATEAGLRDRAAASSGRTLYVVQLLEDHYELTAFDLDARTTRSLTISDASRPEDGEILTHLVGASDGDVILGATLAEGAGASRVRRGTLVRLGIDDGMLVERTRRYLGDAIAGVSTDASGGLAYAAAFVADDAPLCGGGTFTSIDTGVLVSAIDLDP
ncbi:MAG: hypothetical protein J0L92_29030 [Deltaproteobacteria bacterium]|nr:hypothetical protein [Deltaproteobacteria bacterium]